MVTAFTLPVVTGTVLAADVVLIDLENNEIQISQNTFPDHNTATPRILALPGVSMPDTVIVNVPHLSDIVLSQVVVNIGCKGPPPAEE